MPRSEDWIARLDDTLAKPPEEAHAAVRALFAELADEQARLRERLAMISAASFEGLLFHIDTVVIDVNDRLCEMHGYDRAEMLGPDVLRRCVAAEDIPLIVRHIAERYEGGYVATAIRKDGSRFRVEVQTKHSRLGNRPVTVVAIRDVTERERAEALLRESEGRFRELADAAFDITLFSRDGIIVDIRGACERVLGRTPDEMVGRPVFDFMAPSAVPGAQQMIEQNRLGTIDVMAVHASGELVPTHATVVASTLNGLPVRVSGVRDLRPAVRLEAERRALEDRVQRAQRLDSLGVLAGGIAHDFNNLLTGILGNAEYLRDRLTGGDDLEAVRAIVAAAQRAAGLTRQMLAYAGQRDLARREAVDVGDLVRELRTLLDASLSKKAELELAIEPGSVVLGDRATLVQVFMNLLTNASDALGERPGRISVHARPVSEVDARWDAAQGASVRPGRWVLVEVRDTGVGMDEATRGRVFEPFFSTKEKGQGLGLAACLGVVAAHGGAVLVESELGKGSCFSVLLPAGEAPELGHDARSTAPAARPCRVLVVDDETVVRAQLRRSLELRGYTVDEARNGKEALAALSPGAAGAQPDVVILDMTMPDIDGAEVLRRVRADGSRVPIIVSSGYLDVAVQRRLPRGGFQGFLPKPYGATDLVDAIERARAPRSEAPQAS
jgi:PAS domain S-box-containing protein